MTVLEGINNCAGNIVIVQYEHLTVGDCSPKKMEWAHTPESEGAQKELSLLGRRA